MPVDPETELKKAVEGYDLIGEIFPDIKDFYDAYKVLHAQLREGDDLEILLSTTHNKEDQRFDRSPFIEVFLKSEYEVNLG